MSMSGFIPSIETFAKVSNVVGTYVICLHCYRARLQQQQACPQSVSIGDGYQ